MKRAYISNPSEKKMHECINPLKVLIPLKLNEVAFLSIQFLINDAKVVCFYDITKYSATFFLLYSNQIVIFLATLSEEILTIDEVSLRNNLIEVANLFLVE